MADVPSDPVSDLYATLGEAGIAAMVRRFYERVRTDDILGPMYPPDDWEEAERRLRMFLVQRFGGPATYGQERGHPRLRMRHAPFAIDEAAAERWLVLMRQAIAAATEAGEVPATVAEQTMPFFRQVALFMINRPSSTA